MNVAYRTLLAGVMALVFCATAVAHETPGIKHTHAFKQTGYGTYRQGHSVNNELGSITIWSATPINSSNAAAPVKFARPKPITRPPVINHGRPVPLKKPASRTAAVRD